MGTVYIGDVEYPVIGTEPAADVYLAASPWAVAWETAGADPDDAFRQQRALVTASRQISELSWKGSPTLPVDPILGDGITTQRYAWPRTGVTDCAGVAVADGTPSSVEVAVYVLAALSIDDPELFAASDAADGGIKVIQAGSARIEYFGPAASLLAGLPMAVMVGIQCYLAGAASAATGAGEVYGADGEFAFDDCDEYGLNGPL